MTATWPAEALLRIAVDAAREAGELLASWRGDVRPEVLDTKSSPTDVVTEMDRAAEALIARRLLAEPVAVVFAANEPGEELRGLPELVVGGLGEGDARELLGSVIGGPWD